MYGGRVYYIRRIKRLKNLNSGGFYFFALNFSPALKKRYRNKRFRKGFNRYYIMNQNVVKIPSLDLLCSEFNGVKIVRFHDKNFNNLVKQEILKFSKQLSFQRNLTGKALLNRILKQFRKIYDKPVFYRALLYLIDKGFLNIPTNLIKKSNKCYYWLPRGCM